MEENTNWSQSVGCVIINDGKVLLGRQTYGSGKGKLILPGGYLKYGELPEEAALREVMEETGVLVNPNKLLGIRCNRKNWYAIILADYVSGEAYPADEENSEVIWLDVNEALNRSDVPSMTKEAIESACKRVDYAFEDIKYKPEEEKTYQYFAAKK